jgi:methylthioribulose-1-phosphate dehydratase
MIHTRIPSGAVAEVAALGRFAAQRGWVPATSGNFSCRLDERTIAVTRSGADKGNLGANDLIAVDLDGSLPAGVSAETPLHVARYRADRSIGAIAHVHTVAATVLSRRAAERGEVVLEGFEMHKALTGFTTHESTVRIPVFPNAQDTEALATLVEERLGSHADVPAYLLAGHGVYVWGATTDEARRQLEGIEFLLRCALEELKVTK